MAEPLRTYIYHTAMLAFSGTAAIINVATISAILFIRALRNRQNVFTFNLALADCSSAVAVLITNVYDYPGIPFPLKGFSWHIPLFTVGLLISILTTLAIAFERLIVLRIDALGSRQIVTTKRSIITCVIGWVMVPSTYFFVHRFNRSASFLLLYAISPIVILACLVITAFCYVLIYKKIATISNNIGLNDAALRRRAKNSKKILTTCALVVASTSACWVLMCSVLVVEFKYGLSWEPFWFLIVRDIGFVLVSFNGILNPVIIWLRLTEFRGQLNACFGRQLCQGITGSQNPPLDRTDATKSATKQSISTINLSIENITKI